MEHRIKNPIGLLEEEHQVILKMLSIVEGICSSAKQWNADFIEDAGKIVTFLREFADRCHHGKEEDLLFPAMQEHGDEDMQAAIGEMMDQHIRGRNLVAQMAQAVEEARSGKSKDTTVFCKAAMEYVEFLRGHIDIEDNDLFVSARSILTAEEQERLKREFEKVEGEKMGEGVHEEFQALVEELHHKYGI